MSKNGSRRIRSAGAYVVKAAETRSSRVASKSTGRSETPNTSDKTLVDALRRTKQA